MADLPDSTTPTSRPKVSLPDNIGEAEAAAIRARVTSLEDEDGTLRMSKVIADARADPSSPLFKYIEWDDAVAADRYRRRQIHAVLAAIGDDDEDGDDDENGDEDER